MTDVRGAVAALRSLVQRHGHTGADGSLVLPVTSVSGGVATTAWTPVLAGDGTAGTQTYAANGQVGRYSRAGGLVTAQFDILLTAKDAATAGNISIGTLPVTSLNVPGFVQSGWLGIFSSVDLTAGYTHLSCYVLPNDTKLYLSQQGDNIAAANVLAAAIGATTALRGGITYFAA